jgi:putative endonuclease
MTAKGERKTATRTYCAYILASASGVLYTGITNNLRRRMVEHKQKLIPGFTKNYNVKNLVHSEMFADVRVAIDREKQIKSRRREKKVALIEAKNPKWADLSASWFS